MGHNSFWGIAPLLRGLKNPKLFLLFGGIALVVITYYKAWHAEKSPRVTRKMVGQINHEMQNVHVSTTPSSNEIIEDAESVSGTPKNVDNMEESIEHENITSTQKPKHTWTIEDVSPLSLDLARRYDIIIKSVYGIFHRRGAMTSFVRDMYRRHIQVWNNFHEPCKFIGDKDWFDATKPCIKKRKFEHYENSFINTLEAIAQTGFNNSISIVPVTSKGFPLNGAHRVAAALSMSLQTMPVQVVSSKRREPWNRGFFRHLGLQKEFVDFADHQWRLHVKNSSIEDEYWLKYVHDAQEPVHVHVVNVFPSTRGMYQEEVIKILNRNAVILTQRFIHFNNRDAADMFIQHLYPNEAWVSGGGSLGMTNPCYPKGTDELPTWIIFVQTNNSLDSILAMKAEIREMFKLGKHSVHISNKNSQAAAIAKIVLNRNSVKMLNQLPWSTPSQRRQQSPCVPATSDNQTLIYYLDNNPCHMGVAPPEQQASGESSDHNPPEVLDANVTEESPQKTSDEPDQRSQENQQSPETESLEELDKQVQKESGQQTEEESDQQGLLSR